MSNYLSRQNFLKQLATAHPDVRHDELLTDGTRRKAFYKNASDLTATNINGQKFTGASVVFSNYSARLVDRDGSRRVRNLNEWLFLDKRKISNTNPSVTESLDDVYDRMEKICLEFMNYLVDDADENGFCGFFRLLELGSFHWEKEGPIADNFFGWKLTFQDETNVSTLPWPGNVIDYDNMLETEIIFFTNLSQVTISYNATRKSKYGNTPSISVWHTLNEGGIEKYVEAHVEIQMDALPPNQTEYFILNGGNASGFIRLGK